MSNFGVCVRVRVRVTHGGYTTGRWHGVFSACVTIIGCGQARANLLSFDVVSTRLLLYRFDIASVVNELCWEKLCSSCSKAGVLLLVVSVPPRRRI